MANGPLINDSARGAAIGTVIMPGAGTVIGAAAGGLVSLFSGGPQAGNYQANVGGQTIDARQIYLQITGGPGPGSLQDGATAANRLQSVHSNRAGQIAALNQDMDDAWQGGSGRAAQAGAHPLETWLNDSSQNLGTSSTYIGQQAQDFSVVAQKVQPLPDNPPSMGFMDHINPWSDKDSEIDDYNRKGQQNVDAFNAYYQASSQNAAGMPQYSGWTGNSLSNGQGGTSGGTGSGTGGGGYSGGGGASGGGSVRNLPKFDGDTPSTHLLGAGGESGAGSGAGGYNPPSNSTPFGYAPPSWSDSTSASGYVPPNTDYSSSFGPGTSPSFGSGGGGVGAGGFGGAVGFGAGGAGSLSAGTGTGSGFGASGVGGARAGAAGRTGRSGMSGMGGLHGGQSEGSEDEEHETKYLVSEDPNELFGTDELTAPPVIGE